MRVCNFSLRFPAFGPSDFFGPRSKVVQRGEGFACVPVSGSFDKLREVGVLSYLIYPLLKCYVEAVSGRLIGPKTWDRIVGIS